MSELIRNYRQRIRLYDALLGLDGLDQLGTLEGDLITII
jgi:hypothetical protein